jgi:hypothetical protein
MKPALLELAYLPNIHWFRNYVNFGTIWIEREENFIKSSPRNRCEIAGANGIQVLSIPLAGGRDHHQKYKETRISAASDWQNNHWQSIRSAYGSAPFFEFYADKFLPFYNKRYELLFDFNVDLLHLTLEILKEKKPFQFTAIYEVKPADKLDLRLKRSQKIVEDYPCYYQVFEERSGFIPNLSIMDLIFNLGPEARDYLRQ